MLTLHVIGAAAQVVYRELQAAPQYRWALSSQRLDSNDQRFLTRP